VSSTKNSYVYSRQLADYPQKNSNNHYKVQVIPLTLTVAISLQKEKLTPELLEEIRKIVVGKVENPQIELAGNMLITIPVHVTELVYGIADFEQARKIAVSRYKGKTSCVVIEEPEAARSKATMKILYCIKEAKVTVENKEEGEKI
jgi:hypothetical protein